MGPPSVSLVSAFGLFLVFALRHAVLEEICQSCYVGCNNSEQKAVNEAFHDALELVEALDKTSDGNGIFIGFNSAAALKYTGPPSKMTDQIRDIIIRQCSIDLLL